MGLETTEKRMYVIERVIYRASGRQATPVGYVQYDFDIARAIAELESKDPEGTAAGYEARPLEKLV